MDWEFTLLDAIQTVRTPALDLFFKTVTHLGDAGIFWIALGIVLLLFKKTRLCGVCVLASLAAGAALTNLLLKPLAARPRPCWINDSVQLLIKMPRDYSFPSGHSQAAFTAACAVWKNNRKWAVPAFALAALIAFSRLYLYVHFPTDVLGGIAIGALAGVLMSALVRARVKNRREL